MNKEYLTGKKLYGDNFSLKEITKWYNHEKEGYADLYPNVMYSYYDDHKINMFYGFSKLPLKKFDSVMSFGGATGDELIPIIKFANKITIIEPSKKFKHNEIGGKKVAYITPSVIGKISVIDNSYDLITCFSVLHHIPNVSFVLSELNRVLKPGGYLLIKEPIVSMGDWTKSRKGLTKNERGIPLFFFNKVIKNNNFLLIHKSMFRFPTVKLLSFFKLNFSWNSYFTIYLDYFLSKLFFWNNKYHCKNNFEKLRPQSIFLVLKKE